VFVKCLEQNKRKVLVLLCLNYWIGLISLTVLKIVIYQQGTFQTHFLETQFAI